MTRTAPTRHSTDKHVNAAMLGIAALIVLVMVGFSYREWTAYSRLNAAAALAGETQESVETLLSDLRDAETGQRGFLLTAEERYLEPYNRAVQSIPNDLAKLKSLLAASQTQSGNEARLNELVNQKLEELRQTIEIRRTQGAGAAVALVLTDRGKRLMDEIRAVCSEVRRGQKVSQNQASVEGEKVARTALLATVAGSLVLIFLFVVGLEPFVIRGSALRERPWVLRYGAAFGGTAAAILFRMALSPLLRDSHSIFPFVTFLPAVLFAAWYGGLRAGLFSIVLCSISSYYFFIWPEKSWHISSVGDLVGLLVFVLASFGLALI
ncbi:MAG: CHASE3 domain-containing protein, partial [Acidobacteriia bacterium]|nr:CHASE3 domain-containing protein [Terriglobia bacterium]